LTVGSVGLELIGTKSRFLHGFKVGRFIGLDDSEIIFRVN